MKCKACEKELKPEFARDDTKYQFDNALWLGFFGGYGMFVDDLESEATTLNGAAYDAVLCHDCAHDLCEANPWMKKLLRPTESHSHTAEFWAKHPNHEGWDSELEKLF
jgi:hypothetical protein